MRELDTGADHAHVAAKVVRRATLVAAAILRARAAAARLEGVLKPLVRAQVGETIPMVVARVAHGRGGESPADEQHDDHHDRGERNPYKAVDALALVVTDGALLLIDG